MPFYQKGDIKIRYEEAGSGFPLLLTPGGGLNARVSNWPTAVFNSMEIFKNEFRCITMDQRNANGGESTGPIPASKPWDAFADDQLGLLDHLGIKQFLFMGNCIGGCFAGKLLQRAPERVVAAVFCQTVGHRCAFRRLRPLIPVDRDHLFRSIATSVTRVLVAPLDVAVDVSLPRVGQARQEAVPVVNRRDPRAPRSALTADAAARVGGPC